MIHLDTHVVAWLYAGRTDLFPPLAQSLIEGNDLAISPMVVLELQYLFEVGRTKRPAHEVLAALERPLGLRRCDLRFDEVVATGCLQDWTRDPFDRLIVSQAMLRDAPLLTKDRTIHDAYDAAVWTEPR